MTASKMIKRDWFGITLGIFIPIFLFIFVLSTQQYFININSIYSTGLIKIGYYDHIFDPLENTCYRLHQPNDIDIGYYTRGNYDFPRTRGLSFCDILMLPHNLPILFVFFLFLCVFSIGFCWYRKLNPFKFIANLLKGSLNKQAEEDFLRMVETPDNHKNYFIWGLIIFFIFFASLFLLLPLFLLMSN